MIHSTVLDNGLHIITESMPEVRSVSLGIWVNVGSRNDPIDYSGIAHFTEHMMFKGTKKRSAQQIAVEMDTLGGVLNAQTAKEYTVYYTKVLDEHLDKASDILFDLFLNSELDSEELEKEKKVVLQEIHMTEDTPDDHITDLFASAFFKQSPLGYSILGTIDSVEGFKRENIVDFISNTYNPDSIIIAAAGNLEHSHLVDLATAFFEGVKPKKAQPAKLASYSDAGSSLVYNRDIEQVHLTMGAKGPSMCDEVRWTYIVMNTMLGGSMSSMLFQDAREKLGLVYSIYSYMSSYRDCGVLAVYAATTPEHVEKTIDVICENMMNLKKGHMDNNRLNDVKSQIKGNLLLSRESSVNRMSSMAKNEMYYKRDVPVEEVIGKIQAVTLDDITALARDIFIKDRLTMVSLGKIDQASVDIRSI